MLLIWSHLKFSCLVNSQVFTKQQFLDWTKFTAFADDKLNTIMISVSDRVENIVGNGENAGYQHFLLFPQCFQKTSFSGSLKFGIVW